MKRRVLPLSQQSSSAGAPASPSRAMGSTWMRAPCLVMQAPRARRHETVASMSLLVVVHLMSQGPWERAAQMSMRCAALFDEIAAIVPDRGWGSTVAILLRLAATAARPMARASPSANTTSCLAQPSSIIRSKRAMSTRCTSQRPMPRTATTSIWSPTRFLSCKAAWAIS